jgi:phytoene dehydrogenase-like protein
MIIIGAGPAGLTLAHCCSHIGLKILIIDREKNIGGCHRVIRTQDGLFTEHSPRIYLSDYVNVFHIMSELGLKQDDIFVPYKYTMIDIIIKLLPYIHVHEIFTIIFAYLIYIFNPNHGYITSLKDFCISNNFSDIMIEKLDRICRVADGTDINKYSLNKLLSVMDLSGSILQPKEPLDKSLFKRWKTYLESHNVDFALGHEITYIHYNKILKRVYYIVLDNKHTIYLNNLVFAIPPANISKILKNNKEITNAFGDYSKFNEWSENTDYNEYISMTFHYKKNVNLPNINGITIDTDWGIVANALTDYMQHIEDNYKTVISITITLPDSKSSKTGKTANQSTKEEIFEEVYRQIIDSIYPNLTSDYRAILNPNQYYEDNKWKSRDKAYFNTVGTKFIPFQSKHIPNLYNVGTQNGKSYIDYTTMESAVSNAMALSYHLYPELKQRYYIRKSFRLREIIQFIMISILIIFILWHMLKILRTI